MTTPNMLRNVLRDRGGFISVSQQDTAGTIDHVPAHVYDVGFNPDIGLMLLKDRSKFTVPERKYGDHAAWFTAVTSRYDRLNPSMGVLMVGQKGSGKSMLAEDICNWGLAQGLPVLFINQKLPVQLIHGAVSSIGPCIVYFDEFGKSYRASESDSQENERDKMITLFSDTSHQGVLFLVTGNASYEFSDFMIDRPGRFEFRLNFPSLSAKVAADIAEEYKLNPEMREFLLRHTAFASSSFDIATKVASTIRNCNTTDEAVAILSILNVPKPAWYSYVISEVLYRGERVSKLHVTVSSKKDNIINLVIRDKAYTELDSATIDMMSPVASLVSELDPRAAGYLPLGRYSLKVTEHLTIVFQRQLAWERQVIECYAASLEEDEAREEEQAQRSRDFLQSNKVRQPGATWRTTLFASNLSDGSVDHAIG